MSEAPVETDFYTSLREKANAATGRRAVPVSIGGSGYFPYVVENIDGVFNANTYEYVNRRVVPDEGSAVRLADPFTGAFRGVVTSTAFGLSKADESQLVEAELTAQLQANAVVSSYEQTYGRITPNQLEAAKVATKIDYVIDYQVARVWSGADATNTPPLRLASANLSDLEALLPFLPSSARPLLNPISLYLQKIDSVLSLIDTRRYGNAVLDAITAASSSATEKNGGLEIVSSDGIRSLVPGWGVGLSVQEIAANLASDTNSISVMMAVTKIDATQVHAQVSGKGGGVIPIKFVSIGASGSFDLDIYSFRGTGESVTMEMTYPGLTVVPVEPTRWDEVRGIGWYYPKPILDAVRNGASDVTGYVFNPTPQYDFSQGGDFGVLQTLLISRFPTVSINYTQGNWDDFSTDFRQDSSWDLRIFGMKVGSFSQSLYVATAKRNDVGGGFSVTFAPFDQTLSIGPMDRVAYVVGAEVVYPGAAPSLA